jgi:hypothetical protein
LLIPGLGSKPKALELHGREAWEPLIFFEVYGSFSISTKVELPDVLLPKPLKNKLRRKENGLRKRPRLLRKLLRRLSKRPKRTERREKKRSWQLLRRPARKLRKRRIRQERLPRKR